MGKSSRLEYLQLGLHDANDWTTTPADMHYVERAGGNVVTDFEDVPRDYDRGDGQPLSELNGFSIGDLEGLALDLHGLSGGGAGDAVKTDTLDSQITDMLFTSMMGSSPTDYTGETTAAAPGVGATVNLMIAPADLAAGAAVLVKGGTSNLLQARWVEAKDDTALTLCRSLTTDAGVVENAKATEVVHAGRVWDMDFEEDNHRHLAVQGSIKNFRRRLIKGAFGNPRITYPRGVAARYEVTLNGSEWSDPGDDPVPAFVAPTQGNPIRCIHCPLWLDGTLYMAVLDALDPGLVPEAREYDNASQSGKLGFVVTSKAPVLTFRISFGSLTAPTEMNDALLQAAQGNQSALKTTYDLLWQTGRSGGQAKASRFRAASLRVREVTQGSQRAVQVTARATKPTSGSPFSIALF